MNGRVCIACGAAMFEPHKPKCPTITRYTEAPHEPSDNPMVDILSALHRIEEKLDRLALMPKPAIAITVQEKEWLTVKEAAELFSISQRAIYRLKSLHHRRGRSVRIRRSALELHLRASRAAA